MKEPEIKLFGRMILLPEEGGDELTGIYSDKGNVDKSGGGADDDRCSLEVGVEEKLQAEEDQLCEHSETKIHDPFEDPGESHDNNNLEVTDGDHKASVTDDEASVPENHSVVENDQSDATNNQKQTLKKPDKILPCPRCNSMDTKFCYYNNYNVNQHRHFCKSCQRYWTAGGTMRNVPVGAGRRKNKNPASRCGYMRISDALQAARIDSSNGFQHPMMKTNGNVLSFGPDSPFCESMASHQFNLTDKRLPDGVRKEYYKVDREAFASSENGENSCDPSVESSISVSNSRKDGGQNSHQQPAIQNLNVIPSPVPYIPGALWPFPCNTAVPMPAIFPPGFSMPFYPAPYWSCNIPVPWNFPLSVPSSTSNKKEYSSSGQSSPLGKHSRNGELLEPNNPEGKDPLESKNSDNSIIIPKTLRIDDPIEAAKSSIWSTLGIKYDSASRKGLFSALQPKGDEKDSSSTASPVLHSNPAALSRSMNFQETA